MAQKKHLPQHLRSTELKRRIAALMKAAESHGFEVGGLRLNAEGDITLLDKTALPRDSDTETKWLG